MVLCANTSYILTYLCLHQAVSPVELAVLFFLLLSQGPQIDLLFDQKNSCTSGLHMSSAGLLGILTVLILG